MKLLIITQKVDANDDVLGFFENWIRHIAKEVDEVRVIALAKGVYDLPNNVKVFSLGKEKGRNRIFKALIFFWYTIRFLPWSDGVFVHMAPEYVRAIYPVNIFFKKPVCLWYAHIKVSGVAKWAMSHVERIFTPSKESFTIQSEKIIATGHGIDTNIFSPDKNIEKDIPVVMTMSRLSKVKRLDIFIEAINVLHSRYPELSFKAQIVGSPAREEDFQYEKDLKKLVKKYGLTDRITWIGSVKNKETNVLYNKASVFVRLQGGGGFGKTELEAMSCGIPVVLCTDVYNKLLSDYANDLYFKEDDVEACALSIKKVLEWDKIRKDGYSELSRNLVKNNHNIENLVKKIVGEFKLIQKK